MDAMPMDGQSWVGAGASFVAMWTAMMVPMMLPAFAAALWRSRDALDSHGRRQRALLLAAVGVGYYSVWTLAGLVVYPVVTAIAELAMRWPALSRAAPFATGTLIVAAGALQLSAWKARALACCRELPACGAGMPARIRTAWERGHRMGLGCVRCCIGPMAILFAVGPMNPWPMIAFAVAISVERLAPARWRAARAIGSLAIAAGLAMIARAGFPGVR